MVTMAEGRLQVNLDTLASSAAHVGGQAEDLATAHLSSDNQIVSAQAGWVGSSAAALSMKTETWLETSRRLVGRVGGHAVDLNTDGVTFATMEQENVGKVRAVVPGVDGIVGSAGV
ncbi:WXG100 family type VII secretion target [Mycobacterium simiae]